MTALKNRAKIGLESLESREQMSVTIGGLGDPSGILTFTSDSGSDRIEIVDTGRAGGGQLHFRINGGGWIASPTEVWRVALNMGGGNDTVIHNIGRSFDAARPGGLGVAVNGVANGLYREVRGSLGTGADVLHSTTHGNIGNMAGTVATNAATGFAVVLDAGTGNDDIDVRMNGDVAADSTVGVSFTGGSGVDFMDLFANNDVDVATGGLVWVNMFGNDGNDNQQIHYRGELDGKFLLNSQGGANDDWVVAAMTIDAGSMGSVGDPNAPNTAQGNWNRVARLYGEAGNDTVEFKVVNNSGRAYASNSPELHGGIDSDRFTVSPGVTIMDWQPGEPVTF